MYCGMADILEPNPPNLNVRDNPSAFLEGYGSPETGVPSWFLALKFLGVHR